MSELTLVGLHEDGEHVVLEGPDGQRFLLRIDDALRAAVRRDRPQLEQVRAEMAGALPPREIQARIRAGATAEEVAEEAGIPVAVARRYDGPVLAEREYVAGQARAARIGHDPGAPVLGDLVTDRLATREVAADDITWDAFRAGAAPWTVQVRFAVGDAQRTARWTFDLGTRRLRALDDEARWLSETELPDEPVPYRRHLSAVRGAVYDVELDDALPPLPPVAGPEPTAPEPAEPATDALLDDLAGRRGVRQELDPEADDEDDEDFTGFGPQHAFDFDHPELGVAPVPAAHPPASRPQDAVDARVLRMPAVGDAAATGADDEGSGAEHVEAAGPAEQADQAAPAEEPPPRRSRRGRASVPSWDEIVFGAKNE